ncbi:MAG: hypothetical protein C1O27_002257 [Chloroflexi bacterium]|jgi:hypothetical protein|nr:MAG: hypothetical protein C1O27_002257 [Chloroflexota bacterium]
MEPLWTVSEFCLHPERAVFVIAIVPFFGSGFGLTNPISVAANLRALGFTTSIDERPPSALTDQGEGRKMTGRNLADEFRVTRIESSGTGLHPDHLIGAPRVEAGEAAGEPAGRLPGDLA